MRNAKPDERTLASQSLMAGRKQLIALALLTLPGMLHSAGVVTAPLDGLMAGGAITAVGTLGDRLGRSWLLLVGAAAFGAASVLAAFTPSARMLITSRPLQGVVAATLAPSALSLLRKLFPDPKERTIVISVWTSSFALGAAIGPRLGGFLLDHSWWGAAFLINAPVIILLLALGSIFAPEYRGAEAGQADIFSAVFSVIFGIEGFAQTTEVPSPDAALSSSPDFHDGEDLRLRANRRRNLISALCWVCGQIGDGVG